MADALAHLLVRENASGNERDVQISGPVFTLGRQGDNDLVLLDNRISRRHAQILQTPEGFRIEDCGSRHGTFVNGERVDDTRLLKGRDQISLGVSDAYKLTFVTEEAVLPSLLQQIGKATESPAPQLHHLSLLLQMAQMLHRAPALEEVLTTLVDSAVQLASAERGLLFLTDEEGKLRLRLARGRGGTYLAVDAVDYSHSVVERVSRFRHEEVTLEDESTGRPAQETGVISALARGVVALPLQKVQMMEMSGETLHQAVPELLGVLYLESRTHATSVTGLDRQVLQTLAVESATVIENARLFRAAREHERNLHQLAVARTIQQGLLPRQLPKTDYFELKAVTMPCLTVGGDYYDVIPLPGGRYGITVADVSGKGLPAAMMAVTLQGVFSGFASVDPGLEDLFSKVNGFLCERTPMDMYATVFYGVLDRSGLLNFVNAGHVPPLIIRATGQVEPLDFANFPLGMFPGIEFEVRSAQLEPGDQVFIFSDGVTEAQNAAHDFFGDERLTALLEKCGAQPGHSLCTMVVGAVRQFVGEAPPADDLTVTALRFVRPVDASADDQE
ncbi:MAG TPA: SpoIIE family protein phosphatase [Terriglobia bacterium]|nr:SpoIIE family protein phosphatase [Terriglobia bacterium]